MTKEYKPARRDGDVQSMFGYVSHHDVEWAGGCQCIQALRLDCVLTGYLYAIPSLGI